MRRVIGVFLILIGALFVFAAIGTMDSLISRVESVPEIFEPDISLWQRAQKIGGLAYWFVHLSIIYLSFKYGARLVKKRKIVEEEA